MNLGPQPHAFGTTFRLLAPQASRVELCIFASHQEALPMARLASARNEDGVWIAEAPGAGPGTLYAWSVDGPATLEEASFDPHRFLLDPAGWQIARAVATNGLPPLSLVVDPSTTRPQVGRPTVAPQARVIYEAHVKGATRLHPGIPEALRGTYEALGHPAFVAHLRHLGVTTLELLPVHAHLDDAFLLERGLVNFWGYSTLSWFAPHPDWAADPRRAVDEFRQAVDRLHQAGLEVVLDVVYNHSCEGGAGGPVHGLKGLGSWYRSREGAFEDFTGCGNTLDFRKPVVRTLVLESLRHWARLGVDGFRFDLASVHGRMDGGFQAEAPFFQEMASDPLLGPLLRVAEPWDATMEGYGLGRYPEGWLEWNDRFRDDQRLFWKGEGSGATWSRRMAGSLDIYGSAVSSPVDYVACHDGFTLRDLCSYGGKHNEANREGNRDGSDWNHSDNLGEEGETTDRIRLARRGRRARNFLASALLSRGTPMLLAGDELGRTQGGNNNAYCQDNPLSWIHWEPSAPWPDPDWVGAVIALRKSLPDGLLARPVELGGRVGRLDLLHPEGNWTILANPGPTPHEAALSGGGSVRLDTSGTFSVGHRCGGPSLLVPSEALVVIGPG